jgi:hypothetical protein
VGQCFLAWVFESRGEKVQLVLCHRRGPAPEGMRSHFRRHPVSWMPRRYKSAGKIAEELEPQTCGEGDCPTNIYGCDAECRGKAEQSAECCRIDARTCRLERLRGAQACSLVQDILPPAAGCRLRRSGGRLAPGVQQLSPPAGLVDEKDQQNLPVGTKHSRSNSSDAQLSAFFRERVLRQGQGRCLVWSCLVWILRPRFGLARSPRGVGSPRHCLRHASPPRRRAVRLSNKNNGGKGTQRYRRVGRSKTRAKAPRTSKCTLWLQGW